jgi:hypothetical protein
MRYIRWSLFLLCSLALSVHAQDPRAKAELKSDYRNWGWEAVVLENGLITLTVVPGIGARVMQYDLGNHPSVFINEKEVGKIYDLDPKAEWHNYGGYKNWPAPQDRWGWPPPPILDSGPYEFKIAADTPDSAAVWVSSPVERWRTPGLRFERRLTIFPATSRVRVEQTLVNEGERADRWSVWEITQAPVHHPNERDFESFWVYFPLNPNSRYGPKGVRGEGMAAYRGEVAPGVVGVQFMPLNKKLWADPHQGWICYTDEREGYTYARTFTLFPGQEYPDQNATVEVWLNQDPLYLEVEVVSPIVELAPRGGRYTFVEDWWAAQVKGPILHVNQVGATVERLKLDGGTLTGTYGVFHEGVARGVFLGGDGRALSTGQEYAVTPMQTLELREAVHPPAGTVRIEVRVWDRAGRPVGTLDALQVE